MITDIAPTVGSEVWPDRWQLAKRLLPGDDFSTFRMPVREGGPIKSLACEVQVTGHKVRRVGGRDAVRVCITFVGDGEPNTNVRGYMYI